MIRTPEQYVESLRDGRVLFLDGEKIPDITKHPSLKGSINARAYSYALCNHPQFKDLLTSEEEGDRFLFLWNQPRTAEDLIRRRDLYITCMRWGAAMSGMGPDALAASGVVAARMDKQLGTHYTDAVEDYRKHLKKADPAITGAITDVKGNRGMRPSAQVQHKDFYVRVVDKQKDGIVVRGAKMHISATPTANELIISPCRAHREEDKDYAVVFDHPGKRQGRHPFDFAGTLPGNGRGGRVELAHERAGWRSQRVHDCLRRCLRAVEQGIHVRRMAVYQGPGLALWCVRPPLWYLPQGDIH